MIWFTDPLAWWCHKDHPQLWPQFCLLCRYRMTARTTGTMFFFIPIQGGKGWIPVVLRMVRDNFPKSSRKLLLTYCPELNHMLVPEWFTDRGLALPRPIRHLPEAGINLPQAHDKWEENKIWVSFRKKEKIFCWISNKVCYIRDLFMYSCIYLFKKFLTFIYLWVRGRNRAWAGEGQKRGTHRIWSRLQTLSCQHRAQCRAQTHKLWDHVLNQSQMLNWMSHPGAPIWEFLKTLVTYPSSSSRFDIERFCH